MVGDWEKNQTDLPVKIKKVGDDLFNGETSHTFIVSKQVIVSR